MHVRVIDLPTGDPIEGITVDHQRGQLTIMGMWPKSIGGGETDVQGFASIPNVMSGDYFIVLRDGHYAATTKVPMRPPDTPPLHVRAMHEAMWRERVRATEAAKQLRPGDTIGIPVPRGMERIYSDDALVELSDPHRVDTLFMAKLEVTDRAIDAMKNFKYLRFLRLHYTSVTDTGLAALAEFDLLGLDLLGNPKISDEAVAELRRRMPETIINYQPHESQGQPNAR